MEVVLDAVLVEEGELVAARLDDEEGEDDMEVLVPATLDDDELGGTYGGGE